MNKNINDEEESAGKKTSIDKAIDELDNYINMNNQAKNKIIIYLVTFSTILIFPYITIHNLSDSFIYIFGAIFIVVFGVLMALYRYHLNEVAKSVHYKIGFLRMRVAAFQYNKEGFQSEVRESLTNNAFTYESNSIINNKKIESPLPGHPTSDLSTIILNKLLENIEIKKK